MSSLTTIFSGQWADILIFFATSVIGWVVWSFKSRFPSRQEHQTAIDRIAHIELRLQNMPDLHTIHEFSLQLERIEGQLQVVGERLKGFAALSDRMQKQIDLMDEYLKRGRA
jgi:hypothetical protein